MKTEEYIHVDRPNFFNSRDLQVQTFPRVKENDLNQLLKDFDIDVINYLKDKINIVWKGKALSNILRDKNKKYSLKIITNSELSRQSQWFKKILNGYRRLGNYIDILNYFKYQSNHNTMIFATQDLD